MSSNRTKERDFQYPFREYRQTLRMKKLAVTEYSQPQGVWGFQSQKTPLGRSSGLRLPTRYCGLSPHQWTQPTPVLQKSFLPAPPGYCSRLISYRHSVDGADDPTAMPLFKRWPIFQLSHTSGPRGYVDCAPPGSPIPDGLSAVLRSAPLWRLTQTPSLQP